MQDSERQAQQKDSSSTLVSHDAFFAPRALSNGEEREGLLLYLF